MGSRDEEEGFKRGLPIPACNRAAYLGSMVVSSPVNRESWLEDHTDFANRTDGPEAIPDPTPPTTPRHCSIGLGVDSDLDVDLLELGGFQAVLIGS